MPSPHRSDATDRGVAPAAHLLHRPARDIPAPVDRAERVVPEPPRVTPVAEGGWGQALLPVLGSVGLFGFALVGGDTRHLVLAAVLATAMVASGLAGRAIQARRHRAHRARQVDRYLAVLGAIRHDLASAGARQRRWSDIVYPEPLDLWSVTAARIRIWERRPEHPDFLTVRIGTAPEPARQRPVLQSDPMVEYEPGLEQLARQLEAELGTVPDIATLLDLDPLGCVTVTGPPESTRSTAAAIAIQLALFRAPDDLRIVVAAPPQHLADWSWVRRLPHARVDSGPAVVSDVDEVAALLERLCRPRLEHLDRLAAVHPPPARAAFGRVVVIVDGYHPESAVGRLDILDEALARADDIGLTFVCLVVSSHHVPSSSAATITIDDSGSRLSTPDHRITVPLIAPLELCEQIGRVLGPLSLRTRTGRATAFDSPGLMQMLGIDPDNGGLDPAASAGPGAPLRCPIGVGEDGAAIHLDLDEASEGGMGPHGMLIGATGSGKSELLRTIVSGLAATHHPEDLTFLLVDFKGGATFGGLDRLPHSAGMATNLDADPSSIDRMIESLRGEVERRQRLLRLVGFDRADRYRAHRRAHPEGDLDAMPALLVVVDEFGELLNTRPDFSDVFSMLGRLGRSLGIHLLLSTQRLDDGGLRRVEGHLRYRLALRTFTPEESMAVLGTRAAAELPPIPGVGFLRVDGATTPFKAATTGRRVGDLTEMEVLVAAWAGSGVARTAPVWLDPLPTTTTLAAIEPAGAARLVVPIGLQDLPRLQCMPSFSLDLSGQAGHVAIVGGARSGKSTVLATFMVSASLHHDPGDLQIYAVDLGGGGLCRLEDLPHVGAVLTRGHRAEISRLIRRLAALIDERAETFRALRLTGMTEYHELRATDRVEDELGEVVVVVDNWAALTQQLAGDELDLLAKLVGHGLHHGIHLVLTAGRWQDIRPALRDGIGGRLELRLGDPIDSEIDRAAARALPTDTPGRGLTGEGTRIQVALPRLGGSAPGSWADVVDEVRRRHGRADGAPPVRVLPELVAVADLPEPNGPGVVMGLEEHRLGPWQVDLFGPDPHLLVLGDAESGRTNLLRRLVTAIVAEHGPDRVRVAVVDYRRRLAPVVPETHRLAVATSPESAAMLATRVEAVLTCRVDDHVGRPNPNPAIVVVVDDYDLVAGSGGNPLSPLVERLAQGRDLGFHLVLARRVGGIGRTSFEPLFQRVRELNTPGVVLGGDPQEGPVLGGVRARPGPAGRGVWVSRGRTTEVQTALCPDPGHAPVISIAAGGRR